MASSRHAEHDAAHGADAADEAGAAEDGDGEHVELLADHGGRHGLVDAVGLDEPGDAGQEAEIAIGEELDAQDVDADPAGRLRVAAESVDLPADPRAAHQEVGDQHDDAP